MTPPPHTNSKEEVADDYLNYYIKNQSGSGVYVERAVILDRGTRPCFGNRF